MRRLLPLVLLTAGSLAAAEPSGERPLWLRHPAVSPDGTTIAFTYAGRIWRVPAAGGEAVPLTDPDHFSTRPVWSPDSAKIAFASKPHGNLDIFSMPADGSRVTRLTYHSADDLPCAFSPDGESVYFSSSRLGSPQTVLAGAYAHSAQLYTVPVLGGPARLVLPTPALEAAPDPTGKLLLYENRPVYENEWRKGAISDGAHDVWLHDLAAKTHRRLTDFRGEDRDPVWSPDGRDYYYLSERSGSFNVWRAAATPGAKPAQVTHHSGGAVRFLSVARDGTLVYGFEGEIWRQPRGSARAERVPVRLRPVATPAAPARAGTGEYATELVLSPDGRQLAVVARGEIFVVATASGAARRLTTTPGHERDVRFGPDGRSLFFVAERDGDMDIHEFTTSGPGMDTLVAPSPLVERKLVDTDGDVLQPQPSPDGRFLAYLANRNSIRVLDRATGQTAIALPAGYLYSYQDGDTTFAWSPDSRWLTTTAGSVATHQDILLLDASGRRAPVQVTRSGYSDLAPQFSPDGKAVLWISGREGLNPADATQGPFDIFMAYLTRAGFDGKAEVAGADWQPQPAGIERRTKRLTPFSLRPLAFTLSPDHESLLLVERTPTGQAVGRRFDVQTGRMTELFTRSAEGSYVLNAAGTQAYALTDGTLEAIDLATGTGRPLPLNTDMTVDARGERDYFFTHFWRLAKSKFYEPTMHGRDWDALRTRYARFLPHLATWEDFAEMMSELAGELNASHTGCFYLEPAPIADHTASLGLYFDDDYAGPGLRVAAVLPGGPADLPSGRLGPGALLLAFDHEMLDGHSNLDQLLNGLAGTAVQLRVRPAGATANVTETVVPITAKQAADLSAARWVEERKALTAKLSGGRIGYVHLPAMDLDSYQQVYGEVLGDYRRCEALIVDVRYNQGGNRHDQLIALLTGDSVAGFVTRDQELVGRIPLTRWARPTALLQNASSYSDGSIFPHLYKRLKLGPVVGDRVPGTGTAVWWIRPMKGTLKWGVPQLGARDFQTGWFENQETAPDLLVRDDPAAIAAGRDPQLEAAVAALLKKLPRR